MKSFRRGIDLEPPQLLDNQDIDLSAKHGSVMARVTTLCSDASS